MPPPTRTRWALITGATPGSIAEAEAQEFLKRGINVVATRSIEISTKKEEEEEEDILLEHVRPEPGSQEGFLIRLYLDLTRKKSILSAVKIVHELADGKLEFLVNAGATSHIYTTPLLDTDLPTARKSYEVNIFGLISMTQAFFPMLRAAKGMVVNHAVWNSGLLHVPYMGVYASSQAAVLSLSHTLRLELRPFGVRVCTVVTTGGVMMKTEGLVVQGAEIPEGSVYGLIREVVNSRMRGLVGRGDGCDRFRVARETVEELLREDVPVYVTKGYMAGVLCWLYWLLPTSWADSYNNRGSGLDRLERLINGEVEGEKPKVS